MFLPIVEYFLKKRRMEHKFHNHSLRKNCLIEEVLKSTLCKIDKQKHDNLMKIETKRDQFKRLHSRHHIKRSLDLENDHTPPSSLSTITTLELVKNSKRFVSEPNLFARTFSVDRKTSLPVLESNKCLSYRKLKLRDISSQSDSAVSVSLDSGLEGYGSDGAGSTPSDSADDLVNHSTSSHSSPILAFPIIGHSNKRKMPRAKLCFAKTMGDRITSDSGWKYLMTNVFKRLNDSSYKQNIPDDAHIHNVTMDEIALCRYLRVPIKEQVGNMNSDGLGE